MFGGARSRNCPRDVQPRPFAKSPLRGSPSLRDSFLLISGRSLRADIRAKIGASTIFALISALAELIFVKYIKTFLRACGKM